MWGCSFESFLHLHLKHKKVSQQFRAAGLGFLFSPKAFSASLAEVVHPRPDAFPWVGCAPSQGLTNLLLLAHAHWCP